MRAVRIAQEFRKNCAGVRRSAVPTDGSSSAAFCQMMMFMLRMAKKVSTIDETITSHLPGGPIAWNPICAYDGTVSPRAAIVLYDSTISAPV